VSGLRARGGFELTQLSWKNGRLERAELRSTLGGDVRLRYGEQVVTPPDQAGRDLRVHPRQALAPPRPSRTVAAVYRPPFERGTTFHRRSIDRRYNRRAHASRHLDPAAADCVGARLVRARLRERPADPGAHKCLDRRQG
jgi:hypothetical protein